MYIKTKKMLFWNWKTILSKYCNIIKSIKNENDYYVIVDIKLIFEKSEEKLIFLVAVWKWFLNTQWKLWLPMELPIFYDIISSNCFIFHRVHDYHS